jgi:hypothetical protein
MRHAVDLGIDWIDTAAVYGLGHSEEVVGRFLKECPSADRPLVFTKCGLVWNEQDRMAVASRILAPTTVAPEAAVVAPRMSGSKLHQVSQGQQFGLGSRVGSRPGEIILADAVREILVVPCPVVPQRLEELGLNAALAGLLGKLH